MEALFDRNGRAYAWLEVGSGRLFDLRGQNRAFIDGGSVYDWRGHHIGWWQNGHIRDRHGAVALFAAGATGMGVVAPVRSVAPVQPVKAVSPVRPVKAVKPVRPVNKLSWAAEIPF